MGEKKINKKKKQQEKMCAGPSLWCQPAHTIHAAADDYYSSVRACCYNTQAKIIYRARVKTQIAFLSFSIDFKKKAAVSKESLSKPS